MTTFYMIVDRDNGEFMGFKPTLYKTKSAAKGVLSCDPAFRPKYAWAVVEVNIEITGLIPEHTLTEKEFDVLVDVEHDYLDRNAKLCSNYSKIELKKAIDQLDRFKNRYHDLKYI